MCHIIPPHLLQEKKSTENHRITSKKCMQHFISKSASTGKVLKVLCVMSRDVSLGFFPGHTHRLFSLSTSYPTLWKFREPPAPKVVYESIRFKWLGVERRWWQQPQFSMGKSLLQQHFRSCGNDSLSWGQKQNARQKGSFCIKRSNSLLSQEPCPWVLSTGALRSIWKVGLFSLTLIAELLLHLSALVDRNLLLNCWSESINDLSVAIHSCTTIILLPARSFISI